MTNLRILATTLLLGASLLGCAGAEEENVADGPGCAPLSSKADGETIQYMMPTEIVAYQRENHWGAMHLNFHLARRWDALGKSGQAWAKTQGIVKAPLQEGQAKSGLEFFAMHRHMITTLKEKFPEDAALFAGWTSPPIDPGDADSPLPGGAMTPFDPNMKKAIDKLMDDTQLVKFASDDALALYIQTTMRPTYLRPGNRSTDATAGLHNYLHGRFQDDASPINVGDPALNLENEIFWRIHGWIDGRWTRYRELKNLPDTDTVYQKALLDAETWMHAHTGKADDPIECVEVPADVRAVSFN